MGVLWDIVLYGLMALAALALGLFVLFCIVKALLFLPLVLFFVLELALIGLPVYLGIEIHWIGWVAVLLCWPAAAWIFVKCADVVADIL